MEKRFEKTDVERLFGIKTTRLHEWLKFQYIDEVVAPGRGYKYSLSFFDLCSIIFLDGLIAQGLTRVYAGETTRRMRRHIRANNLTKTLPNYFLFANNLSESRPKMITGLYIGRFNAYNEIDLSKFEDYDNVLIVNFSKIVEQVEKAISE